MLPALLAIALAAADGPPATVLSLNPVRYPFEHYNVEVERAVGERLTLWLSPVYYRHPRHYGFGLTPWPHGTTAEAFGADFGGRWFFTGRAPAGWWAGPHLSAFRSRVDMEGQVIEGMVFNLGVNGGYTHVLWDRLVLSGGLGLGYGVPTARPPEGSPRGYQLTHSGLAPAIRINVGVAL